MEFLRFGSNIPGIYWGCCACCIIQNFNVDPDAKVAMQLVDGDGGTALMDSSGKQLYAGPTYRDIFHQRLRFGTFSKRDMPNHAFLAIITQNQISGPTGMKWLAILKEAGFEFVRTITNSVGTGQTVGEPSASATPQGSSANYLFGLFRSIGTGAGTNPFEPPAAWREMEGGKEDAVSFIEQQIELTAGHRDFDRKVWDKIGVPKLITEDEARAAGCTVYNSGKRGGALPSVKAPPAAKPAACCETAAKVAEVKTTAKAASPVTPAA